MSNHLLAAAAGRPGVNRTIFMVFVVMTLAIVVRVARRQTDAAEFYAGGRNFTGPQNGMALAGDYLSAASFLGIAGAIAIYGYDGFLYSIGFLVAWLFYLLAQMAGAGGLVVLLLGVESKTGQSLVIAVVGL